MGVSRTFTSKKLLATVIAAVIIAAASFATGYYVGYDAGSAGAPTIVRIGYLTADIHHMPFFVAFSKGFYEEEGILPKRFEYTNGPTEMLAFSAGDLDAGYAGIGPLLTAKSNGVDIVAVASSNLEGSAIVAKPEIKTVQDLNGKTVGTPGIGTLQASMLFMVEKNLNIKVNATHYAGPTGLPIALSKGEIDAYIAWEPFDAEAVVNGYGHVIYTSHDILPYHQCCVLWVSGKIYREQPDLMKKLIRAHIKAMQFVINDQTDAMNIFANMTGKSVAIVKESWNRMIWNYTLNIESIKTFAGYLIEQGYIKSANVPDIDKFVSAACPVDQSLLEEIAAG
jgi:NitT/TauT family transport system substrate-binding protein